MLNYFHQLVGKFDSGFFGAFLLGIQYLPAATATCMRAVRIYQNISCIR